MKAKGYNFTNFQNNKLLIYR